MFMRLTGALALVACIAGCAHPLTISPDIAKVERPADQQPIAKNVGYYIAGDLRSKSVTTPGGGGDSVTYAPYKDLEPSFYKMLGNVFKDVRQLKSLDDAKAAGAPPLQYIITPEITTNSSSPSPFTWPPTRFDITLVCKVTDLSGNLVSTATVNGQGLAEFDEFKHDFPLSGKRAALDALLKMQDALLQSKELRRD